MSPGPRWKYREGLSPQMQAVVPMIVAEVLVGLPGTLRFGIVVAAGGRALERSGSSEDCGALFEIEANVAFEMDRVAGISARGKIHGAAAGGGRRFDGAVDCGGVDGLPSPVAPNAFTLRMPTLAETSAEGEGFAAMPPLNDGVAARTAPRSGH